jgi:hypothetical protein
MRRHYEPRAQYIVVVGRALILCESRNQQVISYQFVNPVGEFF